MIKSLSNILDFKRLDFSTESAIKYINDSNLVYDKDIINEYRNIYNKRNYSLEYFRDRAYKYANIMTDIESLFNETESIYEQSNSLYKIKNKYSSESFIYGCILSLEDTDADAAAKEVEKGKPNLFIRFFRFLKRIIFGLINFIKSAVISFINWIKYLYAWIKKKLNKDNEFWQKYKDKIREIPPDLTFKGVPYRENIMDELEEVMTILENSRLIRVLEEATKVIELMKQIINIQNKKTGKITPPKFEALDFGNVNDVLDAYEEFNLFMVSLTKIENPNPFKNVTSESLMIQKLNMRFYGKETKPEKTEMVLKTFLTPKNLKSLEKSFIDRLEKIGTTLKSYKKKIDSILFTSSKLAVLLESINDTVISQFNDEDNKDPESWSEKIRFGLKWYKLVIMIVKNIRITIFHTSTVGLEFSSQVAKGLKIVVHDLKL